MPDPRPKTLSENPSSRVISKPAKLTLMRSRNAMMYSRNRNGSRRRLIRRRVRSATEADSRAGVIRNANDIRAREEKALPMIRQLSQWVGMWRKHSCLPRSHSCERLFVFNKTLGQPNSAFSVWRATAGGIRAELRRWFRSRSRRRGDKAEPPIAVPPAAAAPARAVRQTGRAPNPGLEGSYPGRRDSAGWTAARFPKARPPAFLPRHAARAYECERPGRRPLRATRYRWSSDR